ncbi:MAG: crossover junction endodeoxyribonuclease RuvC [Alphaproteobacteria bacterium]|nr:crossover junction endodeoxyribonuclease RuvC [Alphaproteobacteria bacterium]
MCVKIFGIDPGLRSTGWGVINIDGHALSWRGDGMIRPDVSAPDEDRLHQITTEMTAVLETHQPDLVGIEEIFVAKNPSSALRLGMARGAALVAVAAYGCPVQVISARRVKQNVTGSGRADKNQITAMVSRLLGVTPKGVDSADALAIAIATMNDAPVENTTAGARTNDPLADQPSGLDAAIQRALAKENAS